MKKVRVSWFRLKKIRVSWFRLRKIRVSIALRSYIDAGHMYVKETLRAMIEP